jgi:transcriptional regulator with XRE-family HTH domain
MTTKEFRAVLDKLGLTQAAAARLLGADARTFRRYALDETNIPQALALLLRLMVAGKVAPADIEAARRRRAA